MTHQFPRLQSAGLRGAAEVGHEQGVSRTEYAKLKPSPTLCAFDKRIILEKTDPLLAFAYYVEAVADGRALSGETGVDAYSKIAALQQEARRMLRQVGAPLSRVEELYPRGKVDRGV